MAVWKKGDGGILAELPAEGVAGGGLQVPGAGDDMIEELMGEVLGDPALLGDGAGEPATDDDRDDHDDDEDGTLSFSLSDHDGGSIVFDAGDGIDTLKLILDRSEFSALREELTELRDLMAESTGSTAFDGDSASEETGGGEGSAPGGYVFETSFGVTVKDVPALEIHVRGVGPVSLDEGLPDFDSEIAALEAAAASAPTDGPHPSKVMKDVDEKLHGKGDDDDLGGGDGVDDVRGFKGDDDLEGGDGDDWVRGGHGEDRLNGNAGSDIVDGGKGDDTLVYTLAENEGQTDLYDGGKDVDTLELHLTAGEYTELHEELIKIRDWMAETANPKRSESHGVSDHSAVSSKHPVYETSFGLEVRNIEYLEVHVEGYGVVDLDAPLPDQDPEPEPEPETDAGPAADPVVIDLEVAPTTSPEPSAVETRATTTDGAISVESVSATLRPGSQATVSVDVEVRELPPVYDVFMLQDLSGSFWDDLPNVQARFSNLYDTMTSTSDVQFGVGSFIDKPVEAFGSDSVWVGYDETGAPIYTSDYVYKTHLGVTGDMVAIQDSLDSLDTQYGLDWKEAQLEGLVQVALRGDEVGFRDGAQKFVVLSTDAAFHQEGDYAWAPDGANDYDTVIEDEDYPAVAAVGELLKAAGIIPVFAVTEFVVPYYQGLVDIWGFGSVTVLSSDSSNLSTAIIDGLKAATTDLDLTVLGDDYGYVSSMTPETYEDVGPGTYTFDITLEIPEDSVDYSSDSLTLEISGYGEVNVEVEIASVDAAGDSGDDTLSGTDGMNGLYGLAGADTLDGRGGDDTLEGGTGDDTLSGGLGDDIFVFTDGDGDDTITDFAAGDTGGDVIDLRARTAISSFVDVMAAAVQAGDDTVLDFGADDSITLLGVDMTELKEQDFMV